MRSVTLEFVFVDYLQWSWGLCDPPRGLRELRDPGWAEGDVVAASFSEFVKRYVENAEALYPNGSQADKRRLRRSSATKRSRLELGAHLAQLS